MKTNQSSSRQELHHKPSVRDFARESEQRLQMTLKATNAGAWSYDVKNDVTYWSDEAAQIMGADAKKEFDSSELWYSRVHPDDVDALRIKVKQLLSSFTPFHLEFRIVCSDGSIRWIQNVGQFIFDANGEAERAIGVVFDITERRQVELREHELRLRAETLANITLALTSHISIDDLLDEILEQALRLVPYKTANIALIEDDELVIKHWRGYSDDAFIRNLRHPLSETPLDIEIIMSKKPVVLHDTQSEPRWHAFPELSWIRSYICVPIVLHDRVWGMLRCDSEIVGQFSEQDIERLLPLSQAAALALENARLYEQAQQEIAAHKLTQDSLKTLNRELEQRVRLRTQEFLHAKERVEVILDSSSDGIFFAYPDSGIQQANRAFNTLFGCSEDDYFECPVVALVRPQDAMLLGALLEAVIEDGATRHLEIVMVRKDGTTFDAEIGIAHLKLSAKDEGVVCSLRDISLRKRIEAALRTSESQVRALLDGTYTYLGLLEPDGKFVLANKAALAGAGVDDPEHIVGQFIWESPWWTGKETSQQQLKEAVQRAVQGEFVRYEDEQWNVSGTVTMDFSLSPVKDENGQVIFLVPESRDISAKKRSEDTLRQTKNQLQSILDNSSALIYVTDLENRIMLVNRHYEEVFNVRHADLIGRVSTSLFSEETLAILHENDRLVLESRKTMQFEELIPQTDGVHTYLSIKSPLLDDAGNPYALCGISTDITERKKTEEQLRYNANLLNKISDAVISTDTNFVIRSWNRAAETIYGWTAEETIGKVVTGLLDTRFTSGVTVDQVRQRFFMDGFWTGESVQRRKDGSPVYVIASVALLKDENGIPVGTVAVNHDNTQRRQDEEALKRSEADLRSVFDSAPLALMLLDRDLKLRAANIIAQALLQFIFERDVLMGDDFRIYTMFANFDDPDTFERILKGESMTRDVSYPLGQSIYYFHMTYNPVVTGDGNIIGICITGEDITERKHSENELWQALEKQKELSELKTRFVATASHEFRTPLATIQAASDALKNYMHKMTPEQITSRIDKIQSQIKHMVQLLTDVLTLEQIQIGKQQFQPNDLDLVAFCRNLIDELHSDRPSRITFDCPLDRLDLYADERLVRQVIVNILTNAIKYSPEDKPVEFSLRVEGDAAVLKIRDYGIGIPEKDQEHLFEPFYRATNVGTTSGSGLGLVLAKQAVEMHSGSMTFTSKSGLGTTFTVIFPRFGEYKR